MRIFYIFYLLMSCLTSSAQKIVSSSSGKLDAITRELYSIKYPENWNADTSKILGMDLLLRSPKDDSLDIFRENVNVFVQNLNGQNYDLARMGKESESQIKNMVTDVEILQSRLDSTSFPHYYVLKYRGRQGKFVIITHQRYYLKNDVGIAVTFTIQNNKEEEFEELVSDIFGSFRLL